MSNLSTLGVAICVPLVVIFGIIALLNTSHIYKDDSIIFYLTARNTFGARMITLSFFGVTVGTWLFLIPSVLIADPIQGSGWIGLTTYSLSYFGATFMIAWVGSNIKEKYPDIISIGDYAKSRFGYLSQILITGVAFGNMIMGMYFYDNI